MSRLAVLRFAVAWGRITGAVRQRAYAMGDLQSRRVSGCSVPHVETLQTGRFEIHLRYVCVWFNVQTCFNDFMITTVSFTQCWFYCRLNNIASTWPHRPKHPYSNTCTHPTNDPTHISCRGFTPHLLLFASLGFTTIVALTTLEVTPLKNFTLAPFESTTIATS